MSRDSHQKLLEIFAAAYQSGPEERQALLDRECSDDPDLRAAIERVLASHDEVGGFLEVPILREDGRGPGSEGAGRQESVLASLALSQGAPSKVLLRDGNGLNSPLLRSLGPDVCDSLPRDRHNYQVLGELSRGGMGVILKSHDTDLGRDVAMKVLRREFCGHPESVQRFVEEAQIGGQLQHPGIVPVYELGLMADECPYFTMKLVKGETLASLFSVRDSITSERRRLLSIFEQVCQTMAYAHSRGVLHRDVKPSNVMVGPFGEVQVVDWGLAKVIAHGGVADEKRTRQSRSKDTVLETVRSRNGSSHSQEGSVMGTPAYMSPEQARGHLHQVDERSDVFSLGAILCELLTGEPPYVGDRDETLCMAADARLADAKTRLEACKTDRELARLTWRCLAPSLEKRPRNAEKVARAVHAYLAAVEERTHQAEISAAEARIHASDERRARRLTLALAITVLVSLIAGGSGYLSFNARERARRDRLTEAVQANLEESTFQHGQGDLGPALATVERASLLVNQGETDDALMARVLELKRTIEADVARLDAQRELDGRNAQLLEALDRASRLEPSESIPTPSSSSFDAITGRELESLYRMDRVKNIDPSPIRIEAFAAAFRDYGLDFAALEEWEIVAAIRSSGVATEVSAALDYWASATRAAENENEWRMLLRIAQQADPDPWRVRLRDAVVESNAETLLDLSSSSEAVDLPPLSLVLLGKTLRYLDEIGTAADLLRGSVKRHPEHYLLRLELGSALSHERLRSYEEALRHYEAATALRPSSVTSRISMGSVLRSMGALDEAIALLRFGMEQAPCADYHHELLLSLAAKGDFQLAEEECRSLIDLRPDDPDGYLHLGEILLELGRSEEQLVALERGLELARDESMRGELLLDLGEHIAWDLGDPSAALEHLVLATELQPKNHAGHFSLGIARRAAGDRAGAEAAYRVALGLAPEDEVGMALLSSVLPAGDPEAVRLRKRVLAHEPANPRALHIISHALEEDPDSDVVELAELDRRILQIAPDDFGGCFGTTLAWLLVRDPESELFDPEQAYNLLSEALRVSPDAVTMGVQGLTLNRLGRWAEAVQYSRQAIAGLGMLDDSRGFVSPTGRTISEHLVVELSFNWYVLALSQYDLGEAEAALEAHEKARLLLARVPVDNAEGLHVRRFAREVGGVLGIDNGNAE